MILGKKQFEANVFFIIFAPKLLSMTLQKWIEDRAIHGAYRLVQVMLIH